MSLTTEYNGHEIVFSEDRERWHCSALKLEATSLKALKTKINKVDAAMREVDLPCYAISYGHQWQLARIAMIAKPDQWDRSSYTDKNAPRLPTVLIVIAHGNKIERQKKPLRDLIAATPANKELLNQADELRAQARLLNRRADSIVEEIPRITLDEVMASGAKQEDE